MENPGGDAATQAPPPHVIDLSDDAPGETANEAIDLMSESESEVATPRRRRRESAATPDRYDPAVEAARPQWAPPAPKRRRPGNEPA